MGKLGAKAARTVRSAGGVMVGLSVVAAGCGGGGDGGGSARAEVSTGASQAEESRCDHLVVVDFFGFASVGAGELGQWVDDPTDPPDVRLGALETVTAYRTSGYEVVYVAAAPEGTSVDGEPVDEAVGAWLDQYGFPVGAGTTVVTPASDGPAVADELSELAEDGTSLDAAYTNDPAMVDAMIAAGVAPASTYTLGPAAGVGGSRVLPEDDAIAHSGNLTGLERVCGATPG